MSGAIASSSGCDLIWSPIVPALSITCLPPCSIYAVVYGPFRSVTHACSQKPPYTFKRVRDGWGHVDMQAEEGTCGGVTTGF